METLFGFLGDGAGVEGPPEALCDVNTKELGVLDDLHWGSLVWDLCVKVIKIAGNRYLLGKYRKW